MGKQVSFVKACLEFFGTGRYGRKVQIPEFQALTKTDKEEMRTLLIEQEGFNIAPIPEMVGITDGVK